MYQEILLGKVEIGAAVGCASMSNIPYVLMGARTGFKMGHQQLIDLMYNDGMMDAFYNILMGVTAENIAKMYNISREEQDEFALMSHQRACNPSTTRPRHRNLSLSRSRQEKEPHLRQR